jgi:hypothetical protein
MRYFHRTSVAPDDVLVEADRHFGAHCQQVHTDHRSRAYTGTIGRIDLQVEAEGGHYTLIRLKTDQVGESEADKSAKAFLTAVHGKAKPRHVARGAY